MKENLNPYQIRWVWAKRKFNAEGYVQFWKIHVKKMDDPFAKKMLEVAEKTLKIINEEFKKADENFSRYQMDKEELRLSRSEFD